MTEQIKIYTDGSCEPNGRFPNKGGWAFTVQSKNGVEMDLCAGKAKDTTSNRMELMALINAIEWCIGNKGQEAIEAIIYTDSAYCSNGFNKWMYNWFKDSYTQPLKNKDLWQRLYNYRNLPIRVQWVRGHNGLQGNERAHQLAEQFRKI